MQPLRGLPLVLREGLSVALTPPALKRDRFCTVTSVKTVGDGALVGFSGIETMGDAEAISGCRVLVRASDVDLDPLDASVDELHGRPVVDGRYGELGRVSDIMVLPGNDVWVVEGGPYGEVLLPVIDQVIAFIPEAGPILVNVPDGLIDASGPDRVEGDCDAH